MQNKVIRKTGSVYDGIFYDYHTKQEVLSINNRNNINLMIQNTKEYKGPIYLIFMQDTPLLFKRYEINATPLNFQ